MLQHHRLEALDDARSGDLLGAVLVGRAVFDDVAVAVDDGMAEPGADLGRRRDGSCSSAPLGFSRQR
jgi:hypothetical protein